MRVLFGLMLLFLLAVAGVWLGSESWLARQVADMAGQRDDLDLAEARPLRDFRRIGLHLTEPAVKGAGRGLALPSLDLWISPVSPTEIRLDLPQTARLTDAGRDHVLDLSGGAAALRLAVLHGGAVRRASAQASMLRLDGAPLAETVSLDAAMASLGHDAPRDARAGYDLQLSLVGLNTDALAAAGIPDLALPGAVSVTGPMRLWLDGILDLGVISGAAPAPQVTGMRSGGLEVSIGDIRARLAGQIRSDGDGRMEGRLAIYSHDAGAVLRAAGEAGVIPTEGAMLASALLAGLGRMPFPAGSEADGLDMPEPTDGELRLPLVMRDGRLLLGDIDLGAAPVFPALP